MEGGLESKLELLTDEINKFEPSESTSAQRTHLLIRKLENVVGRIIRKNDLVARMHANDGWVLPDYPV